MAGTGSLGFWTSNEGGETQRSESASASALIRRWPLERGTWNEPALAHGDGFELGIRTLKPHAALADFNKSIHVAERVLLTVQFD